MKKKTEKTRKMRYFFRKIGNVIELKSCLLRMTFIQILTQTILFEYGS